MTEWKIIEEEIFISYTGGTAQLISNGECKVHLWESPKSAQLFCDKLNELNNEKDDWRHKVSQLLIILKQFDEEKVKRLLEELEE